MTKEYQVELTSAVQRQIKKIPTEIKKLIIKQLEKLQRIPHPNGVKKLVGMDNLYRIKIKDYRVIYTINNQKLLILVIKIADRKEIYKKLKK